VLDPSERRKLAGWASKASCRAKGLALSQRPLVESTATLDFRLAEGQRFESTISVLRQSRARRLLAKDKFRQHEADYGS
jgi:hypothetical protein